MAKPELQLKTFKSQYRKKVNLVKIDLIVSFSNEPGKTFILYMKFEEGK
jgi:hypothetical protein